MQQTNNGDAVEPVHEEPKRRTTRLRLVEALNDGLWICSGPNEKFAILLILFYFLLQTWVFYCETV